MGRAEDSAETFEKARKQSPDVVIMDLNMPNMSGLEATAAIDADFPGLGILVYTASDKEADLGLRTTCRYKE